MRVKNRGFTIVEMLMVVAVLAVLTGIVATAATSVIHKSRVRKNEALRAALQAAELSGKADRVTVIPTANMIEGYCAIGMDVASSEDTDYRIRLMTDGAKNVEALLLTVATKDFDDGRLCARAGQYLSLVDGEIVGEKEMGNFSGEAEELRDRERSLNDWLIERNW